MNVSIVDIEQVKVSWIGMTAKKMKFSINDFFIKCNQIRNGHIYRGNP